MQSLPPGGAAETSTTCTLGWGAKSAFIWFDGVVKALRTPEARDELAHFAWFECMGVSTHTPPKACG